jgi:hypothetical protein
MCLSRGLLGQSAEQIHLDAIENLELGNLKADIVSYLGRACVRIENTGAPASPTTLAWNARDGRVGGGAKLAVHAAGIEAALLELLLQCRNPQASGT